jgi:hypothetical protein
MRQHAFLQTPHSTASPPLPRPMAVPPERVITFSKLSDREKDKFYQFFVDEGIEVWYLGVGAHGARVAGPEAGWVCGRCSASGGGRGCACTAPLVILASPTPACQAPS